MCEHVIHCTQAEDWGLELIIGWSSAASWLTVGIGFVQAIGQHQVASAAHS